MTNISNEQLDHLVEEMAKKTALKFGAKTHTLDLSSTEKLIAAVVTAIVIGMLAWTVNTTNETAKQVAVIESQITDIKLNSKEVYSASQGKQLELDVDRRLTRVELQLEKWIIKE